MMWYLLLSSCFSLFHGIIQEEIYQNGIDLCIRMVSEDLSSNQFNTPDTTSYRMLASAQFIDDRGTYLSSEFPSCDHSE